MNLDCLLKLYNRSKLHPKINFSNKVQSQIEKKTFKELVVKQKIVFNLVNLKVMSDFFSPQRANKIFALLCIYAIPGQTLLSLFYLVLIEYSFIDWLAGINSRKKLESQLR